MGSFIVALMAIVSVLYVAASPIPTCSMDQIYKRGAFGLKCASAEH